MPPQTPLMMALTQIAHRIPPQVLHAAFDDARPGAPSVPMHERIRSAIMPRLMMDTNTLGGIIKHIALQPAWRETTQTTLFGYSVGQEPYQIYRIPASELEDGFLIAITDVGRNFHISPGLPSSDFANVSGQTSMGAAEQVLASYTGAGYESVPLVELISGDLIRISPADLALGDWVITARISYDESFINLNPRSIKPFCDLAVAAAKAYIYNTIVIKLDTVVNDGGVAMSNLKEIIESYASAEEMYQELLTGFQGAATMTQERMLRILSYQM